MAIDVGIFHSEKRQQVAGAAPALLERALRGGGEHADLFYEYTIRHSAQLRWTRGRGLEARPSVEQQIREGVGVRVLDGAICGFAAASGCVPEAWARAADAARLRGSQRHNPVALSSLVDRTALPVDAPDAISELEKATLLREALDAACTLDARVERVVVQYHDRVRCTAVAASDGVLVAQAVPLVGLRVAVTLSTERRRITAHAVTGSGGGFAHFFAHAPVHLAREAVERAQRRANAKVIPAGKMPVLLTAGWGGVWLHEAVGHALEADTRLPVVKRGERIAPKSITLVDDATLPHGRGSFAFDDEGTPATRTLLIANGILHSRLTDRRHGMPSTGNARRQDHRHPPLPRMTNLLMPAGETAPADLTGDVQDGLYLNAIGHGSVRPGGRFMFEILEGTRIEQGRLTHPVAGMRLVGDGLQSLRKIVGVGSDFKIDTGRGWCEKANQVVPVSVGMPSVLLRDMEIQPLEKYATTRS